MSAAASESFFQIAKAVYYVGQSSILLPVGFGFYYRRQLTASMRAMYYCCLMWLLLMSAAELARILLHNNNGINQLVDILEVWFIGLAYYPAVTTKLRRYFLLIGIAYTAFTLFDLFVLSGLWEAIIYTRVFNNVYAVVLKHVLIIWLVLLYFEQTIYEVRRSPLRTDPLFVVSVGLLLFYISTIFIFLSRDIILGKEWWFISSSLALVNLILHVLLARAFWLAARPESVQQPA